MPIRFQVDADFYDHPKTIDLSDAAVALWTRAGSYSTHKLLDGFVPDGMLARLSRVADEASAELVRHGLWKRVRGGFRFHQWDHRNLTKAEVEADRTYERDKKRRQRAANEDPSNDQRGPIEASSGTRRGREFTAARIPRSEEKPQASNDSVPTGLPPGVPRESPGSPNRSVSVSVSESVSVSGQPRGRPRARCPTHEYDPDPPNCLACRDARRAAEAWDADRRTRGAALPPPSDTARCRLHRGQPADNCAICRSEQLAAEGT